MIDPDGLLDAVPDVADRQARPTRLGTVDAGHIGGDPRVRWDGEDTATATTYQRVSCVVAAGDRVVAVQAGSTWVIVGRIGDPRVSDTGEQLLTDYANGWAANPFPPTARRYGDIVTLSGLIDGGTLQAQALLLPQEFHPSRYMHLVTPSGGGTVGRLEISSAGAIIPYHPSNSAVSIAAAYAGRPSG